MAFVVKIGPSYYSRWREPGGRDRRKSHGKGEVGKKLAEKHCREIELELQTGAYVIEKRMRWRHFMREYKKRVIDGQESCEQHWRAVRMFWGVCNPRFVGEITSKDIEEFTERRKRSKGRDKETVSPYTVNRDLAYLRIMLNTAYEWELLKKPIKVKMLKTPKRAETFVSQEEFSAMYKACPDDWWKAFLLFQFMTGWRVAQVLKIKWDDVDLENKQVLSQAEDNKGNRDVLLPLHDVLVEALSKLERTSDEVFPTKLDFTSLYHPYHAIQKKAGIKPRNTKKGRLYGFHDLRRGFATANAERLDLFELQKLMQHRDITTTQRYVAMAHRLKPAVENLAVPDLA